MEQEKMEFMKKVRDRFTEAETAWRLNYENGLDDIRNLNGEQWPDRVKAEREADGRPCEVVNRLAGFVDQVVGDQRQNKPRITVIPVDQQGDPDIAKIFQGLIKNIENTSDADFAYDTALEHSAGSGIGWIRVLKDYSDSDSFTQDISISRVKNQFSVYMDPLSMQPDGSDARYCFVLEVISKDDHKARFPNAKSMSDAEMAQSTGMGYEGWFMDDKVRIAEYWERNVIERPIVLLSNGITMEKDKATPEALMQMAQGGIDIPTIVKERISNSYEVKQYAVNGHEVIEGPKKWDGKYIPIIPVYGKELVVDGKMMLRGVIRNAKGPQRMYNYWRNMILETLALQPKAPYLVTTDQVAGFEDIWRNANKKSYPYLPYNRTGDPMPQRNFAAPVPAGAFAEAQIAIDDMKATTGIYDASLGSKSNETSGKAIMVRQKEGDTATYVYIDNLTRAIRHVGRILVDLIPKVYDTARIVRIMNRDNTQENLPINKTVMVDGNVVIINDLTVGKYDIVIDAGPSYATQRQEAADNTLKFMQMLPQQAPLMADIAVGNMDWLDADKIAKRLKKAVPPQYLDADEGGGQPPEPPPDPKAMVEMEKLKIEQARFELEKWRAEQEIELAKWKAEQDVQLEEAKIAATNRQTY